MNIRLLMTLVLSLVFISRQADANPDLPVDGKTIFTSRCAACHSVNKTLTGPALAGVHERRSIDWIINFVHSSQSVIKAGDKDALALYEKFNKIPMPDHPDLSKDDIKGIVEFIKAETKNVDVAGKTAVAPAAKRPNYVPLSLEKDSVFFVSFFASVFLLIGTLLFAAHARTLKGDTT